MFAPVARQRRGQFECSVRLLKAAELMKQVASNALQQVIALKGGLMHQLIDDRQCHFRALCHADGNGAVERNDRRTYGCRELPIKSGDARPLRILWRPCLGMAGENGRLEGVKTASSAELACSPKRQHPPLDLELVPEGAVLVQYEDRSALCVSARGSA